MPPVFEFYPLSTSGGCLSVDDSIKVVSVQCAEQIVTVHGSPSGKAFGAMKSDEAVTSPFSVRTVGAASSTGIPARGYTEPLIHTGLQGSAVVPEPEAGET